MATIADQAAEFVAERLKIGELAIDLGQMCRGDSVDRRAGLPLIINETEQLAEPGRA